MDTGDTYVGNVVNDRKEGFGTIIFEDSGERFEGNFVKGLKHGPGTLYYNNWDPKE